MSVAAYRTFEALRERCPLALKTIESLLQDLRPLMAVNQPDCAKRWPHNQRQLIGVWKLSKRPEAHHKLPMQRYVCQDGTLYSHSWLGLTPRRESTGWDDSPDDLKIWIEDLEALKARLSS